MPVLVPVPENSAATGTGNFAGAGTGTDRYCLFHKRKRVFLTVLTGDEIAERSQESLYAKKSPVFRDGEIFFCK